MLCKPWWKTKAMRQTEGNKIIGSDEGDILGLLCKRDVPFTLRETVEDISLKLKRGQGLNNRSPGNYLGSVSNIS